MQKLVLFFGSALFIAAQTGCDYGPPPPPGGYEEASIWNRPPRYGAGGTETQQRRNNYRQYREPAPQPENRYGANSSGNRYSSPDRYSPPAGSGSSRDTGSTSGSTSSPPPIEDDAPVFGQVDTDSAPPSSGHDRVTENGANMKKEETASTGSSSTGGSSTSGSSGSGSGSGKKFDHLPFAVPVPGKVGYVTLPPPNNNLPEIDVRGIEPGTPVEIPDPNNAGNTIQFRVP